MLLYAAYGASLDPTRMAARCPHSPLRETGWLLGWRLTFGAEEHGWDGALVTVVEETGAQVFVALYEVPDEDRRALDDWEGQKSGLYRRMRVRVQTLEGAEAAVIYVLDGYEGGLPSATTIGTLSEAALAAGAPDDYVEDLRQRPCTSIG